MRSTIRRHVHKFVRYPAASGPATTRRASCCCCFAVSFGGRPDARRARRPARPWRRWARFHRRTERRSRSEEHTSELQSRLHLVCRLLLEKKKLGKKPQSSEATQQPTSF